MGDFPIQFISDGEAAALENQNVEALLINIGKSSTFSNLPPKDPWIIDSDLVGVTPYDLWFGLNRLVGRNLTAQFEAGIGLVNWIVSLIENEGYNPFAAIPTSRLPWRYWEALAQKQDNDEKVAAQLERSQVYLVNGLYFAAVNISTDPGVLSAQYKLLPHNRVDFSLVYNPEWGKWSIGANTLGSMPQGSVAILVHQNLTEARERFAKTGKIYTSVVNLDTISAAMLAMGYDLPLVWLKYVEALKLGNFSDRLNKRLPDLTTVGEILSKQDETKGSWGGSPTFQGSSRGERTSIGLEAVLQAMRESFPATWEPTVLALAQSA